MQICSGFNLQRYFFFSHSALSFNLVMMKRNDTLPHINNVTKYVHKQFFFFLIPLYTSHNDKRFIVLYDDSEMGRIMEEQKGGKRRVDGKFWGCLNAFQGMKLRKKISKENSLKIQNFKKVVKKFKIKKSLEKF